MIGVPFDNNDLTCLGSITEFVAWLVEVRDPVITELVERFADNAALAAWIRSLPQRDDMADPDDGPRIEACVPTQRLRIPAPDPNCVERAALYLAVAELIDPRPVRQLATLDFTWGRHTFPIEDGAPVILDPSVPEEDITRAVSGRLCAVHAAAAPATESPTRNASAPLVIDVNDAIEYTTQLAEEGARNTRNGPDWVRVARNAIRTFVQTGAPPGDVPTADAIGWTLAEAERVARRDYGARALTIVRTTARALSDLIDDVLSEQQQQRARNLSAPSWLSDLGSLVGRIGVGVGSMYLAPQLTALGITGEMLALVEKELNSEGYTLGPLVGSTKASAPGPIARVPPKISALGRIAQRA